MVNAVGSLYVEGTNYESEPLDERFKEGLRLLRQGVRDGDRVLKSFGATAERRGGA